jgi:hypothetical protein
MNIAIIKTKLKLILNRILEFRDVPEIIHPKPQLENLFVDYTEIRKNLIEYNHEVFNDLKPVVLSLNQKHGIGGRIYSTYKKSSIELLYYEVEKAINYMVLLENEKSVDQIDKNPLNALNIIITRFHLIAKQIRKRYSDRATLDVKDEYDLQDLLHSLLKLFFNDIRPESYVPTYAGSNSRIDFIIKNESIAIETKMTRNSLKTKEIGDQLIIDIERYKKHPDIDTLVCFVYDPESWIENPEGIETDLSGPREKLNIIVRIEPK